MRDGVRQGRVEGYGSTIARARVGRLHRKVDPLERRVDRPPGLEIPGAFELLGERLRQRLVDDEARPVVPARRVARVQLRPDLLEEQQRIASPQQSAVQRRDQRNGTLDAQRKLRRDDERHTALMERMGEARARTHDRPDVAAVATCHGDDGGAMDPAIVDGRERAGEPFAGDDVGLLVRAPQHESIRIARRIVEVAVAQQVNMRVPRFATLPEDVGRASD